MVIAQNDLAALQSLHRLANERYGKLIDALYERDHDEAEEHRLHYDLRHQRAFIVELNRLIYKAELELVG